MICLFVWDPWGIQLLADNGAQDISSTFLCFIAKTTREMYPKTVDDQALQKTMLENMYRFKASSPVVIDGEKMGDRGEISDQMSLCDTIHEGSESGQAMEVVEHILHITTNTGVRKTLIITSASHTGLFACSSTTLGRISLRSRRPLTYGLR